MEKLPLPKSHFICINNLEDSLLFLANYKVNCGTWGFFLSYLGTLYNEIKENAEISTENKIQILSLIELEAMSKVMELLESFASLCFALSESDKNITQNMVDFNTRGHHNSDEIFNFLVKEKKEYFSKLLTYPDLNTLNLNKKERIFINRIYYCNIRLLKKFFRTIIHFREINKNAYNKYRHSRPFFIGLKTDHPSLSSLSTYYQRNGKKILHSVFIHPKNVFALYMLIGSSIIQLQKEFISSRIAYFESNGIKIPLTAIYFQVSPKVNEMVEKINAKVMENVDRVHINATLKASVNSRIMKNKLDLYKKCSDNFIMSDDAYVEKYANELSKL